MYNENYLPPFFSGSSRHGEPKGRGYPGCLIHGSPRRSKAPRDDGDACMIIVNKQNHQRNHYESCYIWS